MNFLLTSLFSAVVFLWIKVWQMNHDLSTLRSMVAKELSKRESPPKTEYRQQPLPDQSKVLYCSFCGKSQHEAKMLIAGPNIYICNECVTSCTEIINAENQKENKEEEKSASD